MARISATSVNYRPLISSLDFFVTHVFSADREG
jgi:hypothetical protein